MQPTQSAELERANDALQAIGLTLQRLWGAVGEPLMINDRPVYSLRQIDGDEGGA